MSATQPASIDQSGSLWATVLIGIGMMAAIDEIVLRDVLSSRHTPLREA